MTDSEETSQFHQFSLLPPEIRDIIWRATAIPRVVLLRRHIASKEPFSNRIWSNKDVDDATFLHNTALEEGPGNDLSLPRLAFGSRCTLPIASVCHESRQIAKEIYTKAFGSPLSYPTTWFNFEIDTLYLDWQCERDGEIPFMANDMDRIDTSRVRRLALCDGIGNNHWLARNESYTQWLHKVLPFFPSLETVTLVDKEHSWKEARDLVEMDGVHAVKSTIKILGDPKLYGHNPKQIQGHREYAVRWAAHVDVENLRRLRDFDVDAKLSDGYEMPVFSYSTVTARRSMEEYYRTKRRFYEAHQAPLRKETQ